MTVKNKTKLFI